MSTANDREDSTTQTVLIILAVFAVLFILLALVCGGGMYLLFTKGMQQIAQLGQIGQFAQGPPSPEAGFQQQETDYAAERAKFKTNLLSRLPSPQNYTTEVPGVGVVQVNYPSGDLTLRAWVTPPGDPSNPKRPAVLFLHAGHAFDHTDWEMALPYQNAGYVVMVPMLRGENGLPGSFSLLYDEVDDAIHAADYLAKRPDVDPEHIYLAGDEIGASLALLTAEASKGFRAAAVIEAPWDPVANARKFPDAARFNQSDIKEFTMRSPVAFANGFKCPVRLYAPSGATFVQLHREAQEVAQRAKSKGLDVEAVMLPGNQGSIVNAAIRASIEFFKKVDQRPVPQTPSAVKSGETKQSSK